MDKRETSNEAIDFDRPDDVARLRCTLSQHQQQKYTVRDLLGRFEACAELLEAQH